MTQLEEKEGNPICRRSYIRIEGELGSPLLVGSGKEELTDMDVILDAKGQPFVPGSSLAGALRHYLAELSDNTQVDYWFGSRDERQSRLFVYDMKLTEVELDRRDGVKLDAFKTAEDLGKYEMQIVERGAQYTIRLELVARANDCLQNEAADKACEFTADTGGILQIRKLIDGLAEGEITLGAKSRRGFGKLKVDDVRVKHFDLTNSEECHAWLDWDWEDPNAFDGAEEWPQGQTGANMVRDHCLRVPLKVRRSLMIRKYALQRFNAVNLPDYEQLQSAGRPAIPGTSWMGAVRGRLRTILENPDIGLSEEEAQKKLEPLLGTWTKGPQTKQSLQASAIRVEESMIQGGYGLPLTRNAIDRFTGGTVRGALYTAVPWIGGRTELVLRWPRSLPTLSAEAICGLLLWVIADLQNGLLAVGGETAVGRGTFEADGDIKMDGNPLYDRRPYYKAAMDWCKQQAKGRESG